MITISNKKHWLIEQAAKRPNDRAILTEQSFVSYQKFFEASNLTANYLLTLNIKKNDHVGILCRHTYDFFVLVNALWFIGAIPVPLNSRKTTNEIENEIHLADINFLIVDETISSQFSEINFINKIQIKLENVFKSQIIKSIFPNLPFSILNCSLIMFTSGSTGNPKAVVHTFQSLYESIQALDSFAQLSSGDIWLASLPLYHIGGFMILCRSLLSGSLVVFPASPKFEDINQTIKQSDPTHISLVPTTLDRLLKENVSPSKNLKYVFLGGSPSQTELITEAIKKSWPIVKVYGSTETCSMITALHPDEIKPKPNSVGKLLGKNKIKIMNESENDLGEVAVFSKSLFKEYYNDLPTTNNKLKNSWYRTGDFGRIDNEGYLYIESRRDDLIISGGENITSYEVELAIKKHPFVKDVFVFALQDKKWGQIVCAAIVSETISEDVIKDFLKEKIASYKIPKRFFIINEIPRNEMGKANRAELLKQLKLS
ncbi:MAG: o-succinylbenzoate--CoA ligase [Ignavibacteriales bacterium]|nr:MAG: o-succinylbenzoate--CoA ligase [Ignavibacteriales bacterium]